VVDTTFSALTARNSDYIRKTLDAIVFVAPIATTVPPTLTAGTTGALQTLPAGYVDVGWMDASNAVNLASGVTASPVDSFGSLYPTRSDITKVTKTIAITCHETKATTMGLYSQVDMTAINSNTTSGEVAYSDPVRPSTMFYRLFVLWTDLSGTDTIFGGISFPRVSVTALADMKLDPGINAMARGLTFTAYPDSTLGYAQRNYLGGPGIKSRAVAMGFTVGTGS
jgi:hypothetical protein